VNFDRKQFFALLLAYAAYRIIISAPEGALIGILWWMGLSFRCPAPWW